MKEINLVCNAHLDPVWLWQRQEGMAEAISTFRVAADFCEKFDGFVFNHNESVLYEWVEEYEPELFARIQKLVKEGKWKIMGGWYLQPDCLMPTGESIIRQIEIGNQYFEEKFGVHPETALNMDSFGHDRGLVQILKKAGYKNYLFMRPFQKIPEADFVWKGYDGSEVLGHNMMSTYCTTRGEAVETLKFYAEQVDKEKCLMCWGIGNHGGGPSEVDWLAIQEYAAEHPEIKIISGGCEDYFDKIDKEELRTFDESLEHCMIGCYTTMTSIKRKHRQLENELSVCEKMLAVSGVEYDKNRMKEAQKALLFSEFHDSLPGTMIRDAESDMLRLMESGRETLSVNMAKAFFKLCEGQPAGKHGEIPILIFNPNPYEIEQNVEVEFQLQIPNYTPNQVTVGRVRTQDGTYLPTQNVKERCMKHLDWRKKIAFNAKLAPMSLNRYDCELTVTDEPIRPVTAYEQNDTHMLFTNDRMSVSINKNTGLIDSYIVDGVSYLKEGSGGIHAYQDDEDSWGMKVDGFFDKIGEFKLLSAKEANAFNGYPDEPCENVRVIENGDVLARVQAIFGYRKSYAVVTYTIPKHGTYVDMHIKMFSQEPNTLYKLKFPVEMKESRFIGQTMFGRDELRQEEKEVHYQKWCGMFEDGKGFAVLNDGTYGGSAADNTMNVTLLRTPIYTCHPILDRSYADHDMNHDHTDVGRREFNYRLTTEVSTLDMQAEVYNQPVYALSFFPSGHGEKKDTRIELTNPSHIMTRLQKLDDGKMLVRILNASDKEESGNICIDMQEHEVKLAAYEFKTYLYDGETWTTKETI